MLSKGRNKVSGFVLIARLSSLTARSYQTPDAEHIEGTFQDVSRASRDAKSDATPALQLVLQAEGELLPPSRVREVA